MSSRKPSEPSAIDPLVTVPDMFDAILDDADDTDLAIAAIRQLSKLALQQCGPLAGTEAIHALIHATLRRVDDIEVGNRWVQECVSKHVKELAMAGTPKIGGAE